MPLTSIRGLALLAILSERTDKESLMSKRCVLKRLFVGAALAAGIPAELAWAQPSSGTTSTLLSRATFSSFKVERQQFTEKAPASGRLSAEAERVRRRRPIWEVEVEAGRSERVAQSPRPRLRLREVGNDDVLRIRRSRLPVDCSPRWRGVPRCRRVRAHRDQRDLGACNKRRHVLCTTGRCASHG